ncbi:Gfo/Idh/MocA family protein [Maribacter arenosus]|uniref:Gfo/Idh/MocA family oxidoreductase n=1 Tax=Maribacter arenosus TaxID=1854708 RepID=A0ABR7VG73_9FLAO|nr:Gfo/Idh/MocA family oxidoreductase [Maribacter arenosus]MBD0852639.1 Gfo/Idh/MocA family oxidoreductase [Maribacter arenosus]
MVQKIINKICWGIIGVGDVCETKSGPPLIQVPNSSVKAVMRRNSEKAKDFARRHGVEKWYDNADDLLNDPEINAIYIATPPETHAEYTLKAAALGKPVYVEKPMARSHKECQSMVEACKKANVPLYVAYYRRTLPNILEVKELIDSGSIGDIRSVDITVQMTIENEIVGTHDHPNNWRVDPEVAGGGYFYDLASHQLDALDFLFGPIIEAKGFSENQSKEYKADDITVGVFKFKNGILGKGLWVFNTSKASQYEMTTIIGSKGQISFPFWGDHHVTLEKENEPVKKFEFEIPKYIQTLLIQTIVKDLQGKGKCPSTGVSGARTNWVLEQIAE